MSHDQSSHHLPTIWWVLPLAVGAIVFIFLIFTNEAYQAALSMLTDGISITLRITALAFAGALLLGSVIGLGTLSRFCVVNQIATMYIELMNGMPLVILVLYVAMILVPYSAGELSSVWLHDLSYEGRFIITLAVVYAAFVAQSIRTAWLAVRRKYRRLTGLLTLLIGGNLINLIKDSTLATVLAVPDMTHTARLEYASTLDASPVFHILLFLYLATTISLNLMLKWLEQALISPIDRLTKEPFGITNEQA